MQLRRRRGARDESPGDLDDDRRREQRRSDGDRDRNPGREILGDTKQWWKGSRRGRQRGRDA